MEAKLVHSGQYRRYGDTFRVWEIKTDGESKEEVLKYIRENVHKADLPPIRRVERKRPIRRRTTQ